MPLQHRALMAVALALRLATLAGCGQDGECESGDCEPCVGTACSLVCTQIDDDEDVGHGNCRLSCADGADCTADCKGTRCDVHCDDSRCSDVNESWSGADCTNGADCDVEYVRQLYCEASTCRAERANLVVCVAGSDCAITRPAKGTSMSCDATSSCHLTCEGGCVLCCNGSEDCAMECLTAATTCENGVIACGTYCEPFPYGPRECLSFTTALE